MSASAAPGRVRGRPQAPAGEADGLHQRDELRAMYLAYAAPAGSAFLDRALYLPRSLTSDPGRCRAAGVAQDTAFVPKPTLALQMITRALDADTPAAWAAADEVYGQDPALRAGLARRGLGYVLAIPKRHLVITGIGAPRDLAGKAAARPGLAADVRQARRQRPPLV